MKCPYCGSDVITIHSSVIYGENAPDYGLMQACANYPKCDSYGHQTVADAELRELRRACHREFDKIWKSGEKTRKSAYAWLCRKLKLHRRDGHIALLRKDKCKELLKHISEYEYKSFS